MLDSQYNMYSIDTGHFYSNHEKYLHDMNCKYRRERNYIKNKLILLEEKLLDIGYSPDDIKNFKNNKLECLCILDDTFEIVDQFLFLGMLIKHKRKKAMESKSQLVKLLKNKTNINIKTNGKHHERIIREQDLNDTNVISVFNSVISRTLEIKQDEFTNDLIVVQVYYFDIFKDIMFHGFTYQSEKYIYFTSSAGQIRKKKGVFIKKSTWDRINKTILCGLTVEKINAKGGSNINKHLAYMALSNSATDEWIDFDIDRCIVIDDFETNVSGEFDYINDVTYQVTRKQGEVPIPHTDGCGMMLPTVSKKNFMVRLPWVKGLLGVFDFKKFIIENNCSPLIDDIYGENHNIIEEDIQIIFTKSQFKMWKYYNSWQHYKDSFKIYNCKAGKCNIEENKIKNAKMNYQMLQTLTDITENEINLICDKSIQKLINICESKDTMFDILGITPYNSNLTPLQEAIKLYPSLLSDIYVKDTIREVKNSLLKKYRSGKIEVSGKYTFVLPDLYACCEYWFKHESNPKGLLQDKEIYCELFKNFEKVDCLRSPHLYREHAIRYNLAYKEFPNKKEKLSNWFTTNAIYTSVYDLISRILQFDVDGDKLLVISDKTLIEVAERNMKDVVPLYYEMKKANPAIINKESVYSGLNDAFIHGNIGIYSNNISKIWNHDVFINGTQEEKKEAIEVIKLLCMENNFSIDQAKTQYMPVRPDNINERISRFTNLKLPKFFEFAKDKSCNQVCTRNKSLVNKLYDKIPNVKINSRKLKLEKLDYKILMKNPNIECDDKVIELYSILNRQYKYMFNSQDNKVGNFRYITCKIRDKLYEFGYSENELTDMLVKHLFSNNIRGKQLLWNCYGDYIVENIKQNYKIEKVKEFQCVDCGEWFEVDSSYKSKRCSKCRKIERSRINKINYIKSKKNKIQTS